MNNIKIQSNNFNKLALIEIEKKNYNKAIILLDKALAEEKDNFELYLNRGKCFEKCRKLKQAINDYDKSIDLNPNISSTYKFRGNVRSKFKKFNLAIEDFTKQLS